MKCGNNSKVKLEINCVVLYIFLFNIFVYLFLQWMWIISLKKLAKIRQKNEKITSL